MLYSPIISTPFFPVKGEMELRLFKNSYLSVIAEQLGISTPLVMKEVQRPLDCESWQEYRFDLLRQLKPIFHEGAQYFPLHTTGNSRTVVAYIHEELEDLLLNLVSCSEDCIAYLKACTTTEYPYGIHRLEGVTVKLNDDEHDGVLTDGLGYISEDLLSDEIGANNIVQMRCFHSALSKSGIVKGLLKIDRYLPARCITLSRSQLKGKIYENEWSGVIGLDIGILRKFEGPPSKADDSWSFLEYWHDLRDTEIPDAVAKAKKYCEIMKDPLKICQYRGILKKKGDIHNFLIPNKKPPQEKISRGF